LQIIFLGTSAGRPTKTRNVQAIALKHKNKKEWFLFDCGEATQHQIQKIPLLTIAKLKYIFITHLHGDHIYGIFGLLATRSMIEDVGLLTIYGPKGIKKLLNTVFNLTQLNLIFELKIVEFEDEDVFKVEDFEILVVKLSHSIDSFAFIIKEQDKPGHLDVFKLKNDGLPEGPLYGQLKSGNEVVYNEKIFKPKDYLSNPIKGRVVVIAGDNDRPDILIPYIKKIGYLDLFIHEATYTQDIFEKLEIKVKHSAAKNVAIAAQKMDAKNLILTHFSTRYTATHSKMGLNTAKLYAEARKYYEGNLFLANDFDIFELDSESREMILKHIN